MAGRTIAIGDIHGCDKALAAIIDAIEPTADDTIVTLGDYIDRGPDSNRVVERLLELQKACILVPLLGNHEQMLLAAIENEADAEFWMQCGGQATLESYGGDLQRIPEGHLNFIKDCAFAYETETHLFVHANYDSTVPVNEQDDYVMLWKHLTAPLPAPHISGKTAVVGHTPQMSGEILNAGHLICIDTWCFGDGWLTALDVETMAITQCNRHGEVR